MEKNIHISLPVKLSYSGMEAFLRKKMVGEIIQKERENGESRNFAQILEISLYRSPLENFDLVLDLEVQTLTKIWKNKRVDLAFHMCMDFDEEQQKVFISSYKMVADSKSRIADVLLEGIFNSWFYNKIKGKMGHDFTSEINRELSKANEKLSHQPEAAKGVFLSGSLDTIHIENIETGQQHFHISLRLEGGIAVEIKEIKI